MASTILHFIDAGSSAATIAGILTGLASGGLTLIAAGKQSIKMYLKKQIKKKGRKAVIAM